MQQDPFLTPEALAARWNIKENTLNQWRWNGKGPRFHKINKIVLYKINEIEAFENKRIRISTSQNEYYNLEENHMNAQK